MRWLDRLIVYVMLTALWILVMPRAKGDEFDDAFAQYKAAKAKKAVPLVDVKAKCACGCEQTGKCQCRNCNDHSADKDNPGASGPVACACGCVVTGSCDCHDCNHVKPVTLDSIAAPKNTYKHDCGCPLMQCNCGAEGCHCSENRLDNRQPSRWVREDGYWYLYRGSQCLGVMKVNGKQFFQWNGTGYLPTPMKPPTVPPYRSQEQTRAVQQAPVCRT